MSPFHSGPNSAETLPSTEIISDTQDIQFLSLGCYLWAPKGRNLLHDSDDVIKCTATQNTPGYIFFNKDMSEGHAGCRRTAKYMEGQDERGQQIKIRLKPATQNNQETNSP